MSAGALWVLLALLLGHPAAHNAASEACPPPPPNSSWAYETLASFSPGITLCSDFIWAIDKFGLAEELRQASRGKLILAPTNSAMQLAFLAAGLYKPAGQVPAAGTAAFRRALLSTLITRTLSPLVPIARVGCHALYFTRNVSHPEAGILRGAPRRQRVKAAAVDSKSFSVLGQGYNAITGFPLAYGMSAIDPGFTLQPIFKLSDARVRSIPVGGSCQAELSSRSYFSESDVQKEFAISMSLSGPITILTFTGSAFFQIMRNDFQQTQSAATFSGAKVYSAGYALNGGAAGQQLDEDFIENVRPLIGNPYNRYVLQSLVDNYGTHYIKTLYVGGIVSIMYTMTASQTVTVQYAAGGASLSATIAGIVTVRGSFSTSSSLKTTISTKATTFGVKLIPSEVDLALVGAEDQKNSYVDCWKWTQNIQEAFAQKGWEAPVQYMLAPLTDTFSLPQLWPEEFRTALPAIKDAFYKYSALCGDKATTFDATSTSECTAVSDECVVGSFRLKGICISCFKSPQDGGVGPGCLVETAVSCDIGRCYCKPSVLRTAPTADPAQLWANPSYRCVPLPT